MQVSVTRTYHITLTDLELAKILVDPRPFQQELRARRAAEHNEIEGDVVEGERPAAGERVLRQIAGKSPHVRKAMSKFKSKSSDTVECEECHKSFLRRGLKKHMRSAHTAPESSCVPRA